jgi:hypothetical protein
VHKGFILSLNSKVGKNKTPLHYLLIHEQEREVKKEQTHKIKNKSWDHETRPTVGYM